MTESKNLKIILKFFLLPYKLSDFFCKKKACQFVFSLILDLKEHASRLSLTITEDMLLCMKISHTLIRKCVAMAVSILPVLYCVKGF